MANVVRHDRLSMNYVNKSSILDVRDKILHANDVIDVLYKMDGTQDINPAYLE